MINNKNILITGGAGFIGGKLAYELSKYNKIYVYDNLFHERKDFTNEVNDKDIFFINGDILNYELLHNTIKDKSINIVIHAAGIAGIETVTKDSVRTMEVNAVGTFNVLKACNENKQNIEHIIDFSTSEVFGQIAYKTTETDNTVTCATGDARWVYAVSKLAAEHMSYCYHRQYGLPVTTVRPFNVYGPGQVGDSAMRTFILNAINNKDIKIHGDGSQIRAWCYIDDFIEGILSCLSHKESVGECFNIGDSKSVVTIYGLAKTILRLAHSKSNIVFEERQQADVSLRIPSVEKAKNLLNFEAKTDLEDGIMKTISYFKGEK